MLCGISWSPNAQSNAVSSPSTSTNSKLIAFIISYTFATAATYLMHLAFGETDLSDWHTWVQLAPPLTITLIFGFFASGWRQLNLLMLTSIVIDSIFANTSFYFDPSDWEPLSPLTGGSQLGLAILALIYFTVSSFFLFSLAYLVASVYRYFLTRRKNLANPENLAA